MGPEGLRVGIFVSSLNDQLKTLFFFFFKRYAPCTFTVIILESSLCFQIPGGYFSSIF